MTPYKKLQKQLDIALAVLVIALLVGMCWSLLEAVDTIHGVMARRGYK